tara:strand:+ start:218 stop:430 length:213 start_codon:yes stop_codon:yes gene_type:complete
MIKWIKNLFCKIIGIKQCQCPEDEHIELYTKVPEPETPIYTDVDGKAVKCGTHSRYKKSCFICKEVAGEI